MRMETLTGLWCILGMVGVVLSAESLELSEQALHSAVVKFYMLKAGEWPGLQDKFREDMAAGASTFCRTDYGSCGLTRWESRFAFNADDVVSSRQDLHEKYYYNVTFYIKFNANVPLAFKNYTTYILNKGAAEGAADAAVEDLNNHIGHSVVGVGTNKYSPPPDLRMNAIMIPVGVVGLLLIPIIIMVTCLCYKKHSDKKAAREARARQIEG